MDDGYYIFKLEEDTNSTTLSPESHLECNDSKLELFESYGKALLETDFTLAIIYCCIMGIALTVGVFGNIIIVVITAGTRAMNNVGRDFVMNLAIADLCVSGVADPLCILGVLKGEKWFQGRRILCELVASMCLTACICAFLSLTLLSINRYLFVCQNYWYHRIMKRPICITLCVICWITAFLFEFPNFVGWGGHYFDQKNHQCIWDRTASFSYTLFVSGGLIGGPLILMGVCFILVFYKIWSSKRDLYIFDKDDPLRMRRIWKESLRTSRTLVIIFIAFVICWTPYAVVIAFDNSDTASTEVHLFVTLLAHLHSSLNFTIFVCSNKNFRQAVHSLLRCGKLAQMSYLGSSDKDRTTDTYSRSDKTSSEISQNSGQHLKKNLTEIYESGQIEIGEKGVAKKSLSNDNSFKEIKNYKY
ncbi:hypothetical protein ACF0H5_001380 [Mactra antiquata]